MEGLYYAKEVWFYDLSLESFWQISMSPKHEDSIQLEQLPVLNTCVLILFLSLNNLLCKNNTEKINTV